MFKAEAERIDDRMAAHARGRAGEFGDFLAHGELRIEAPIHELNGGGRWFQAAADNVSREENAAVNGRTGFVISKRRKQVWMREDADALRGIEFDLVKSFVVMRFGRCDVLAFQFFTFAVGLFTWSF